PPGPSLFPYTTLFRSPALQASIPPSIKLTIMQDRTTTIRASVRDVEIALMAAIGLVILVVFLFLRTVRSTVIPAVAVPISLIGRSEEHTSELQSRGHL